MLMVAFFFLQAPFIFEMLKDWRDLGHFIENNVLW